jgi:hypothetical protein
LKIERRLFREREGSGGEGRGTREDDEDSTFIQWISIH